MNCDLEKTDLKFRMIFLQSQDTGMVRKGKSPLRKDIGDNGITFTG